MLELADTMIDLKLPVLLVALKDTSYTFLKQTGTSGRARSRGRRHLRRGRLG